jgi:hypothetical protein
VPGREANVDALNPLTMSQRASVTSQAKMGTTAMATHPGMDAERPNRRAVL